MSAKTLVTVQAIGCVSRCRICMKFTQTPQEIEVNKHQLELLQADNFLKVTVLDKKDTDGKANNGDADFVAELQKLGFTGAEDKKPTVDDLKKLGLVVSAKERDQAWAILQDNEIETEQGDK